MIALATSLNTILIVLLALLGVVILLLVVLGFWWAITYNRLVKLSNKVQSSWTQIDVQLKRRFELIPELIKVFNDYSKDDLSLLDQLNEIKKSAGAINKKTTVGEMAQINIRFNALMKEFISDNKEVLGDSQFNDINKVFADTHNKIVFSQRFYNDSVTLYNNKRQVFPYSFVARVRNFNQAELFEIK